jgi:predicted ribonuclease YlaK
LAKQKYYNNENYNSEKPNRIRFDDNPEQMELRRLIEDNKTKIIFCTGNAGTGKGFTTIYTSYQLVQNKKYDKILYTRNPVQLGEEMGYLPGDIGDKFNPFMACLFDNLANIERLGGPLKTDMMSKIEITPVAFLRGRSLENCIIIVDEAQNLDLITLKAILTRVGQYCKVVLLGSLNQIDSKVQAKKEKCDFQRVKECLQEFDFVGEIELIQSKRSKICALVDEKLRELK